LDFVGGNAAYFLSIPLSILLTYWASLLSDFFIDSLFSTSLSFWRGMKHHS
jgi:hypothetical protein